MNIGAIDIGSNAVRLLIGKVVSHTSESLKINKLSFIRIPVRLGKDVFSSGKISKKKTEKLEKTMMAFKLVMDIYDVKSYRACATSAMRDASNGKEIAKKILEKSGVDIHIIEGSEEAALIYKTFYSQNFNLSKNYLFVDVGGGSTEITVLDKGQWVKSKSFNIGTIRKLNDHFLEDEWDSMKKWLKEFLTKEKDYEMIGSGGSINKILKLQAPKGVREIDFKTLKGYVAYLESFTVEQRIEELGLKEDRADVIVPAGQIYLQVMKLAQIDQMIVPKIGLSDGIIYDLYSQKNPS